MKILAEIAENLVVFYVQEAKNRRNLDWYVCFYKSFFLFKFVFVNSSLS